MSELNAVSISTIIKALGGRKNIAHIENCLTRVRVKVYDLSLVDEKVIAAIPEVIGVTDVDQVVHIIMGADKARPVAKQLNESLPAFDDADVIELIKFIGGKENIKEVDNCFVRLRLTLKDITKADFNGLLTIEAVSGVIKNDDGQLHIVLGPIKAREAANKLKAVL